jgi:hypothetical protein
VVSIYIDLMRFGGLDQTATVIRQERS